MNCFVFSGRLGGDAEGREVSGKYVVNFTVANKTGFGEREHTEWIKCAMWGDRGKKLIDKLKKGAFVSVTGVATADSYQKKDGTTACVISVNVNNVEDLGLGSKDGAASEPKRESKPYVPPDDLDDSIPF